MEAMSQELTGAGHAVTFTVMNVAGEEGSQDLLAAECSFPLFQDVADVDAWGQHAAEQEDFYVYDAEGRLASFFGVLSPDALDTTRLEDRLRLREAVLAAEGP